MATPEAPSPPPLPFTARTSTLVEVPGRRPASVAIRVVPLPGVVVRGPQVAPASVLSS